ncbi:MAG: hypothetical protein ABR612_08560 [Chromatocurvus sp.]
MAWSVTGAQCGSILVLASAFVFLMTYLALSTVDLAVVEARMADALRAQVAARTLLDGATRVVVPRERARWLQALEDGDAPACDLPGFCDDARGWVAFHDTGQYLVTYQARGRGAVAGGNDGRAVQSAVSSHVHYQSVAFEVDVRVSRRADNATLARAAVGVDLSASRRIGE